MKTRFDQFAKQLLLRALGEAGTVEAGRETSTEPQVVDVWFEPASDATPALEHLGVLGLLAQQPCLLEPFHEPPSAEEILGCIAKQLALQADRRRSGNSSGELPHLWILSAGRPDAVLEAFGLAASSMPGLFEAPRGFRMHLVVISSLPKTGSTLLLRLLGAGRTFATALDELMGLPRDAWEQAVALPLLIRLRFEVAAMEPAERTEEEKRILRAHQAFEEFERRAIDKGIEEGIARAHQAFEEFERRAIDKGVAQGVAQGIERRISRRLGRPLDDAEKTTVNLRLESLGAERLDDVVLDSTAQELARWLADPDAR